MGRHGMGHHGGVASWYGASWQSAVMAVILPDYLTSSDETVHTQSLISKWQKKRG
jgi:hypothetical protein